MSVEFKILDNGITIINDQIDVESASIGVWIGAGSSNENNDECGIAHMLEHMAFKGTKNRNAETIAREIEDVGGDINAYTSKEVTAYFLKVLKENAELGVDILSDIIKNSTFPQDEIERERGVIISEIGQSYDAPDDRVFENFTKTAFKNQPMGRPILGTKETVSSFKQSDLKFYLDSNYTPENMVVSMSGNLNNDNLFKIVEESSLASGVRRIVAVTGEAALKLFQNQSELMLEIQRRLNCNEDELFDRVLQLYEDKKSLEKKIKLLSRSDESEISQWVEDSTKVNDHVVVVRKLSIGDADELKRLGDRLISNIGSGIGILFDDGGEKPAAVVVVSADLVKKELNAGKLAKEIGSFMGGGGGGKPHLATAGGKDSNAIDNAMKKTGELIKNTLA